MKGFCLFLSSLAGLFLLAATPSFADEIPQAGNRASLEVPPLSQGEALLKGGASGRKRGAGGRSPASSSAPVQVGGICPLPYGSTAHVGSAGYGACGQAKSDSGAVH